MITRIIDAGPLQDPLWTSLLGRDYRRPLDLAQYRRAHEKWMRAGEALGMVAHVAGPIDMEISRGAWAVPCRECRAGVSTLYRADEARCFSCGAIYTPVGWPSHADAQALIKLLLYRKPIHRNWIPSEDLAAVMAQNVAHGDRIDL